MTIKRKKKNQIWSEPEPDRVETGLIGSSGNTSPTPISGSIELGSSSNTFARLSRLHKPFPLPRPRPRLRRKQRRRKWVYGAGDMAEVEEVEKTKNMEEVLKPFYKRASEAEVPFPAPFLPPKSLTIIIYENPNQ